MRCSRVWISCSRCGWDVAEWLERLTALAEVAAVLGSIPASSDIVESEGRQIKQCWTKYIIKKIPLLKVLRDFPPCYSQSPLLMDFIPSPHLSKSGLKLVWNVNTVHRNLKSENSQDYAQKPQRNCTFMNLASDKLSPQSACGRCYINKWQYKKLVSSCCLFPDKM